MLGESRFSRRISRLENVIKSFFFWIASLYKDIICEREYLLDSFPVAICKNIRIKRSKIALGEDFRGYTASTKEYFYGIKVQLITTRD